MHEFDFGYKHAHRKDNYVEKRVSTISINQAHNLKEG